MNFMHFHNSCSRNCDHHTLLIMTGNAHKESCLKLSLIFMMEHWLYIIKTDCSGIMVVAFTITKIKYFVVSLFCNVELPSFLLIFVVLSCFGCAIGLVLEIAKKAAMASLKSCIAFL